ncbi:MAG: Maf-like protein [Salaquimonas sp.]
MNLILASKSPYRAKIMRDAGLKFDVATSDIDERAIEAPLHESDMPPADIAEVLAIAKAEDVSGRNLGALVIGSDQVLAFEDEMLHKPENMEEARRRLLMLSGKTHQLHSAVVLYLESKLVWSHVETTSIKFRKLSPEFIGHHLAGVGEKALSSVGAYQIEGEGIQLIEKITGDFFSIIGLPLLPLLAELRRIGHLES